MYPPPLYLELSYPELGWHLLAMLTVSDQSDPNPGPVSGDLSLQSLDTLLYPLSLWWCADTDRGEHCSMVTTGHQCHQPATQPSLVHTQPRDWGLGLAMALLTLNMVTWHITHQHCCNHQRWIPIWEKVSVLNSLLYSGKNIPNDLYVRRIFILNLFYINH